MPMAREGPIVLIMPNEATVRPRKPMITVDAEAVMTVLMLLEVAVTASLAPPSNRSFSLAASSSRNLLIMNRQ